jgi:hypothetical protein
VNIPNEQLWNLWLASRSDFESPSKSKGGSRIVLFLHILDLSDG